MSTRAVIARPRGDGFEGRYHHSDGYPSGLGSYLWRLAHERGVEWCHETLIDKHDGGWSFILDADWTKAPGWPDDRMAMYQTIDGTFTRVDFRPMCYCHGARNEHHDLITDDGDDWGAEYAYVLSARALVVYARRGDRWVPLANLPLHGDEPDWKKLNAVEAEA